ncbi:MAG: pyridoxamine 5'-phosphate oxidase family protein [Clostridia bacterium]|nr:pyridoxamine 5'-phosphate oxidase family protein [Clostridia bacterium]
MTNVEKVNAFLDKAGVWFFLTTNGERPKGRPFSFHLLKDDTLYFGTGTEKSTYKEFTANPQVEILAVSEGQFLRYDGTVVLVDDDELAEAVLAANPAIHTFINEEAGSRFAMFKLADGHAVLGSMKGHTEEFDV